jgi:CRISPR-associated protein Csx10
MLNGGFNRTWKLPLPQSYMLAAGSLITFTLDTTLTVQVVKHLEAQGVGERRTEGFGRVVFNWHNDMELTSLGKRSLVQPQSKINVVEFVELDDTTQSIAKKMAQRMAQRLLAIQTERAILNYVKDTSIDNPPQASQLNRLRVLVRQNRARGSAGAAEVLTQFKKFKPAGSQQFNRARIRRGGTLIPLDEWITSLLTQGSFVQTVRTYLAIQPNTVQVAEQQSQLDNEFAAMTALRLLSTVLEKSVREKQQDQRKEESV